MQTGTGLGLAIVNSIVNSKSVDGKVEVWSAENVGTDIKVTVTIEPTDEEEQQTPPVQEPMQTDGVATVSLLGFDDPHRGVQLLRRVVTNYLTSWWGFQVVPPDTPGHISIVNEDLTPLIHAIEAKDSRWPFIVLTAARGDSRLMATVNEYERIGGFCRVLYKPGGPSRLRAALKLCLHALKISLQALAAEGEELEFDPTVKGLASPSSAASDTLAPSPSTAHGGVFRRNSEETRAHLLGSRPSMGRRSITVHPVTTWSNMTPHAEEDQGTPSPPPSPRPKSISHIQDEPIPTITIGTSASLLKSSVGTLDPASGIRVLIIEDNSILRNLL